MFYEGAGGGGGKADLVCSKKIVSKEKEKTFLWLCNC